MGEIFVKSCPKCEGTVYLDETNEAACLACGNRNFHKVNLLLKVMKHAEESLRDKRKGARSKYAS